MIIAMSGLPIDVVDTGAGSLYGLSGGANPPARPNWGPGASRDTAGMNIPAGYFFNLFRFCEAACRAGRSNNSKFKQAVKADAAGTDIGAVGRNVLHGPHQVKSTSQ